MVLDSDFLSETFEVPAPIRYVDLKVAEGAEDQVLAALDRTMTEPFVVETVADAEQAGRAGRVLPGSPSCSVWSLWRSAPSWSPTRWP